jgi:ABC-type nitrate/sulfonate/bicarbonate transport system permease component
MRRYTGALLYAALPAALVFLWWGLSALGLTNPYLVPSPQKTFAAAASLAGSGELARHLLVSLGRVWAGFGISACAALPLALAFHASSAARKIFHGVFELLRAIPPLAMIPLLILWFGIGEASKLALIVLATFFPVFLSALNGFDSMDPRWRELADSLGLSSARRLRRVLVPAALPQIVTGLRLGFGYAWRALVGAELFSSSAGLGYLISDAEEMARVDTVYVGIIFIGGLGLFFDTVFRVFLRRFTLAAEDRAWGA